MRFSTSRIAATATKLDDRDCRIDIFSHRSAWAKFCVSPQSHCPSGPHENSILLAVGVTKGYTWALVAGGQDVCVAPDGSLSFTEPHQDDVYPLGSIATGFVYTPPRALPDGSQSPATVGCNGNGSTGWLACPTTGTYSYQVFADIPTLKFPGDCLGFEAITSANYASTPEVWEYI